VVHIINGEKLSARMSGDIRRVHAANPPAAKNGNAEHLFLTDELNAMIVASDKFCQ